MPTAGNGHDNDIHAHIVPVAPPGFTWLVWLAASSLLAGISFAALFWFFGQLELSTAHNRHTAHLLNDAERLLSSIKDAETAQRGYLLTGDESLLQPYFLVSNSINRQVAELQRQTRIIEARRHLDLLVPLVNAKMAQLSSHIDLRRNNRLAEVITAMHAGHGPALMDGIRDEINGFIAIEQQSYQQGEKKLQSDMRQLSVIFISTCLLMALLALALSWLIYRHSTMNRMRKMLLDTQQGLQMLEASNRQLQLVNTALQISQEKLAVTLYSIGDGVIVTDGQGRVTLLNPVAEQLTGWTYREAEGRTVNDIFHIIKKDNREPAIIPIMETLNTGNRKALTNHTILIARDGQEVDIADSCAPIHDRNANVIGAVLVFRDVTGEFAVQQSLRDSNTQISAILNTVADGIITFHSDDGRIATLNPAVERLFGYNAAELVGQKFSLLLPGLSDDLCNSHFARANSGHDSSQPDNAREMTGHHKNGQAFPLELALGEMWLGGQRYFTGILRDISKRKHEEAELIQAGALQKAIFDSENFSSIATDARGVIQIFNVGAEHMLGFSADEVVNRMTPADISDPDEIIERAKTLSAELAITIQPGFDAMTFKAAQGIADIYELTYIRKDGSRFPALVSVTALRDNQDKIIGYLLIGTDNTAARLADEKMRAANAMVYAWGQALNSFAIVAETDTSGTIIYANDPFCRISQYSREELIGKNHREVVNSGHHTQGFWQDMWHTISRGQIWQGEVKNRAKDGSIYWVDSIIVPQLDASGKPASYLSFRFLITERKLLDQMLRETNIKLTIAKTAADKANLAKSDFLSSMSHELRTPLSAILGFAQLIQSGSPGPTATQARNIEQILTAGWYLLELINEILDLAQIESGKLSLSLESISLGQVMLECQAMIEPQAKKSDILLSFPASNMQVNVKADRIRLKQILINLLSNAIKYNKPGGSVIVACSEPSTGRLRISVTDTGAGLSAEKIAQLFQPFNRLGQECNTIEGTGIGLVMSKRLIELMGGEIGLHSTVGEGCQFWIDIDLSQERKIATHKTGHQHIRKNVVPTSENVHKLLYIEDNPANLMLIEDLISRRPDIHLLTARDGISGIRMARDMQPDVILMDINLPGINGFEAKKILSADQATVHIPVVAISANAMLTDISKGLDAGFFRYLTKPINVEGFMDTLNLALEFAQHEPNFTHRDEQDD